MNVKKMIRKVPITIMLPNDVVDLFYKMIEQEEKELGIKRNLSAVIYRSLKGAHPEMPQYDIDQVYSRRRREIETSTFEQPKDPLRLHEKPWEFMTDNERIAYMENYAKERQKKESKPNE